MTVLAMSPLQSACCLAIGEPEMVDTALEPRLSRIFSNRILSRYPAFKDDFYGMEEAIEQIVAYLKHSAKAWKRRSRSCIIH